MILGILAVLCLTYGCSNDKKITESDFPLNFPFEFDPSVSLQRTQLLFAANDTLVNINSGLYKADINFPIRRLFLQGDSMSSPTSGNDLNHIAYLKNKQIYYYLADSDSSYPSTIIGQFQSITFANDSILLASDGSNIFLVNILRGSTDSLTAGYDPNVIASDSFVYAVDVANTLTSVKMTNLSLSFDQTITTGRQVDSIRYPTISSDRNWLAYSRLYNGDRYLYSIENIDTSDPMIERRLTPCFSPKVLIIKPNVILLSGADGLFRQSDYFGSQIVIYGVFE